MLNRALSLLLILATAPLLAQQPGWTIVAIHDSQESWEAFRDNILMPRMQQGIDGGFAAPPVETTFPVHNQESA